MFQIEDIKEKNIDKFYEIYLKGGKIKLIESIAEGLGKRTYFTIDSQGIIKRNKINLALSLITTLDESNYKEIIKDIIENMVDLTQREKIKKIERLSKYSIDTLIKNFNKILASGNRIFGLKYGKELFFRDKNLFFKMLFDYILLEDIDTQKSIMAWSLYDFLKNNEFSDEVFYVGMSYILQRCAVFTQYEKLTSTNILEETSKEKVIEVANKSKSLEVISYGKILNEFTYTKEAIYTEKLKRFLEE